MNFRQLMAMVEANKRLPEVVNPTTHIIKKHTSAGRLRVPNNQMGSAFYKAVIEKTGGVIK